MAAIADYAAITLILNRQYSSREFTYMAFITGLLATSALTHLIGAYGFFVDNPSLLGIYDNIGVLILILELGVFLGYGCNSLLCHWDAAHDRRGNKDNL